MDTSEQSARDLHDIYGIPTLTPTGFFAARIQKQDHVHPFTGAKLHDLHVVLVLLEHGHPGEGEYKSPAGTE
jgi:hypothetical protein